VKAHLSLDFENLETPIQAFQRKKPQVEMGEIIMGNHMYTRVL
jgi:hypothetical protein